MAGELVKKDLTPAQVWSMACTAAGSKHFGRNSPQDVFAIMMYAKELGLGPWQCLFGGMSSINGRIEISARLMNLMLRKAGHRVEILESTNKTCRLMGTRGDTGETAEVEFSMDEARSAGLSEKDPWKKYPSDMLFARAISRLCRRLTPDVIGTAYVEGEISDEVRQPSQPRHQPAMIEPIEAELVVEKYSIEDLTAWVEENFFTHRHKDNLPAYLSFCQDKIQQNVKAWFSDKSMSTPEAMDIAIERWKQKQTKSTEENVNA